MESFVADSIVSFDRERCNSIQLYARIIIDMTREEAEQKAKSMPRLSALVHFRNHVVDVKWVGIDIILEGGNKCGVGNPDAIAVAKKAMLELLDHQIDKEMVSGCETLKLKETCDEGILQRG